MRGDDLLLAHLAVFAAEQPDDAEERPSAQERLAAALGPDLADELVDRLTGARPT